MFQPCWRRCGSGPATALGWTDVLNAMTFARRMHADQNRKDGLETLWQRSRILTMIEIQFWAMLS